MVYGVGIFALLGRFDLLQDVLNTDPSLVKKILITVLPTPKMVAFFRLWLLFQVAQVAADPFGYLDMADILVKQNRYFNRVLNDYFPEDDQVSAGGKCLIKSSYITNYVVIENLFFFSPRIRARFE